MKTYNPKAVAITILGTYDVEGWVSCTINRDEDETTEQRGADGKLSTTLNSNEGGTIELEVLQESEANRLIAGLTAIRQRTGLLPKFTFQVVDPSGSVVETMQGVYLKRGAGSSVAATAGTKTHIFYAETISPLPIPNGFTPEVSAFGNIEAVLNTIETNTIAGI